MWKQWLEQYQETGGGSLTLLDVKVMAGAVWGDRCKQWLEQYRETGGGSLTLLDVEAVAGAVSGDRRRELDVAGCESNGWSSMGRQV